MHHNCSLSLSLSLSNIHFPLAEIYIIRQTNCVIYKLRGNCFALNHWFSLNLSCSVAMGFYILLRAVDRFAANYNSFPGQFEG